MNKQNQPNGHGLSHGRNQNKGNKSHIKPASILFYPKLKTSIPTNGAYSHNMSRQRTFTNYYACLESQDRVRQPTFVDDTSKNVQQIQLQQITPHQTQKDKLHQQTLSQLINKTKRAKSGSCDSNSVSDYDDPTTVLNNIKANYNRNISSLSESLDLFKITSSAAAKLLGPNQSSFLNIDCRSSNDDRQITKSEVGSYEQYSSSKTSSHVKQLLILKLKKKRQIYEQNLNNNNSSTNHLNTCSNRYATN